MSEAPTLKEVEKQEERLRETRERVRELEARERELSEQVADALADGEDPDELRAERGGVQQEIEDLSAAAEVLEERVEDRRERALEAAAEERLAEIKRQQGGNAGEHPRRKERLQEAAETFVARVEAVNEAYARQRQLRAEAKALVEEFGLEMPELKRFVPPARDDDLQEVQEATSGVSIARPGHWNAGNVPPDSRTAELLDMASGTEAEEPEEDEMDPALERELKRVASEDEAREFVAAHEGGA